MSEQEADKGDLTQVFLKKRIPLDITDFKVDPKLTSKDIHDILWRCRDFELSHLWQRSIFLTAFFVLCFTGYGSMLLEIFSVYNSGKIDNLWILHAAAFLLTLVGIMLSAMWIMMGKGSKAWYEIYEHAIQAFEQDPAYTDVSAIGGFQYTKINGYKKLDIVNRLSSLKGGAYSPSRINTGIGYLTFTLWISGSFFHLLCVLILKIDCFNWTNCVLMTLLVFLEIFIVWVLCHILTKTFKSQVIMDILKESGKKNEDEQQSKK